MQVSKISSVPTVSTTSEATKPSILTFGAKKPPKYVEISNEIRKDGNSFFKKILSNIRRIANNLNTKSKNYIYPSGDIISKNNIALDSKFMGCEASGLRVQRRPKK